MKIKKYLIIITLAIIIIMISIYAIYFFQKRTTISEEEVIDIVQTQYKGEVNNITEISKDDENLYMVEFQNNTGEYILNLKKNTGEISSLEAVTTQETEASSLSEQEAIQLLEDEVGGIVGEVEEEEQFYSITIKKQDKEELYVVNKYSGEVQLQNSSAIENQVQNAYITEEKATQIALEEVPGTITDIELEDDDNERVYDIEIESSDGREVSLYLNAYTGNIVSINWEDD